MAEHLTKYEIRRIRRVQKAIAKDHRMANPTGKSKYARKKAR